MIFRELLGDLFMKRNKRIKVLSEKPLRTWQSFGMGLRSAL